MTIQGAMNELINLLNADDIPIYYKGCIKKVIETIDDYIDGKDDYVKRRADRKTEPQKICKYCNGKCSWWVDGDCRNDDCRFKPKDEPQTERSGE